MTPNMDWKTIDSITQTKFIRGSLTTLLTVPILCRLAGSFQANHGWLNSLANALDYRVESIPINLLRLFWASFLSSLGIALTKIGIPPLVTANQTAIEWSASTQEGRQLLDLIKRQHGQNNASKVQQDLFRGFETALAAANSSKPLIRVTISLAYVLSALLLVRVLAQQIALVFRFTNLQRLFWGG